jgi:hypothetical protein
LMHIMVYSILYNILDSSEKIKLLQMVESLAKIQRLV